ncbi:DUF1684 domain-containing protein [Niabella hibiscisoli]|uniref:DUF1684 domain-containing protein n=1 Tax=Niabella hibiscisoli TaxID=1825928 RepID=UPI001F0EA8AF|nr:DUF1684 domain-containing protein [Niabella hibiscisoli]MCH5714934.1 DUF1684 domain-containing protein [Niabella hibiscisoli]
MRAFINNYTLNHGVVKNQDQQYLQFFPIDEKARINARFEPVKNAEWFILPTSSGRSKMYRQYGKLRFVYEDVAQELYVYQSQALLLDPKHADHLFLPFTDLTTGQESYETGRYIDLSISEIKNNQVTVDFNKAYNPYCAYISGIYSCPIPPKENRLKVAIKAGEKKYLKAH